MDRKEIFRDILFDLIDNGYLNDFINITFNYDLKENDYVYIQCKINDDNVILNIFDNNNGNRFNAYVFDFGVSNILFEKQIDNDVCVMRIYVNNCYRKCKSEVVSSNLFRVSSLFVVKSTKEFEDIIKGIYPKEIKEIIYGKIKINHK